MFDSIFEDLKNVPDQLPVIPAGSYTGVVSGHLIDVVDTKDGLQKNVLRVQITLQGNESVVMTDGETLVDGAVVEYTIWLPDEADKNVPSKFGKGTMYDASLRKLKNFFKVCGVELDQYSSLSEALQSVNGTQVIVEITNETTDDGLMYERVKRVK